MGSCLIVEGSVLWPSFDIWYMTGMYWVQIRGPYYRALGLGCRSSGGNSFASAYGMPGPDNEGYGSEVRAALENPKCPSTSLVLMSRHQNTTAPLNPKDLL